MVRPGRQGSGGMLIQPGWVQIGRGERSRWEITGLESTRPPVSFGLDLLEFLLELLQGREAHHSKEV